MAWKRFWGRLWRRRAAQPAAPDEEEALEPRRKLVQEQERSLDEATYELLAHGLARDAPASRPRRYWPRLSPREQDVAALIFAGYNNPQIAYLLGVSLETVRTHVQRILRKFDMHSKAELRAALQQEGAEGRIQQRLEELLSAPPAPDAKG